jgi:putative SOS response-associated peptidase YedK
MLSWADAVFLESLNAWTEDGGNDAPVILRVMDALPVIVLDQETGKRRVIPMRWGFPHPADWRRPQSIHARSETIDTMPAFAQAFREGQRGIVLMKNFNEAPDIAGPTQQHTITPGDETALAAAFVWRRFEGEGLPGPMLACVLVTVPANALIASLPTDRMPAFLAPEDWAKWLGEEPAGIDALKACLRTAPGARWTMAREERQAKAPRRKPTPSNPKGFI